MTVAGRSAEIVRRAGTEQRPIVRLEGVDDREGADALRGMALTVEEIEAPALGEGEWWAHELEGCTVRRRRASDRDGAADDRAALVRGAGGATRDDRVQPTGSTHPRCCRADGERRDPTHGGRRARIEVDMGFLGEASPESGERGGQ